MIEFRVHAVLFACRHSKGSNCTHLLQIQFWFYNGISYPYYEVTIGGGALCDLTGQPRKSHLRFICHKGATFKVCLYQMSVIVTMSALISHSSFLPGQMLEPKAHFISQSCVYYTITIVCSN